MNIDNSERISISELNQILSQEKKHSTSNIDIRFTKPVNRVDIAFIGGLFLLNKEKGTSFSIDFTSFTNDNLYEYKQYIKQLEHLYKIKANSFIIDNININRELVASISYSPILLISKESFNYFFEKKLSPESDELDHKYIGALDYKKSTQLVKDYLNEPKSIKNSLLEKPRIYTYIFSILFAKKNPIRQGINIDNRDNTINALWQFTKDYVIGIRELAKNILQHSSSKIGIITIRAYSEPSKNSYDLETHVFDFGKIGLVQKLESYTENLCKKNKTVDSIVLKKLEEDLILIRGNYCFEDFLIPNIKTKLFQQLYRDIAHYGLMKFFNVIKENQGSVFFSTNHKSNTASRDSNIVDNKTELINRGTNFFFFLPFEEELFKIKKEIFKDIEGKTQGSLQVSNSLSEALKLKKIDNIVDIKEKDKVRYILNSNLKSKIKDRDDEANFLAPIIKVIDNLNESIKYLSFNFHNIKELSSSSLLRILASISSKASIPVIIYNLDYNLYKQMIDENNLFYKAKTLEELDDNIPYWYENKSILLYTRLEGYKYNFADLLFGKNIDEYDTSNFIISHTFSNTNTILKNIENTNSITTLNIENNNTLKPFFYQSTLLPFDVILQSEDNKTILEQNLKYIVTKQIQLKKTPTVNLESYLKNISGFKFNDIHFKIGSKIHSKHFYFAKQLFHDSFYTSRIGLMIAKLIKEALDDISEEISLYGYEVYSELLLSLIKKYLEELGVKKVNHSILIDKEGTLEEWNKTTLFKKAIIIIPIASTGSTGLKIKKYITEKDAEAVVLDVYNILRAFDKSFEEEFDDTSNQKNFLELETEWETPDKCELCFDNQKSKALFETDKSSLTPALIFELPKAKEIKYYSENTNSNLSYQDLLDKKLTYNINEIEFKGSLLYRNKKRNFNQHIFSTDSNELIKNEKNNFLIKEWLANVKKELKISSTDKITIVSSSHYSNTKFINLVNTILFNSSANIRYYETGVDYLSNFKLLNKENLKKKDSKIFYVDDSIITGRTFFTIYNLLGYATDFEGNKIRGAIFLSNKSSDYINQRLNKAAKKVFSFVNINLPNIPKVLSDRPLEHEANRYSLISRKALHDVYKNTFLTKKENIEDNSKEYSPYKQEKHIDLFRITNALYVYFNSATYDDFNEIETLEDLIKECNYPHEKKQNHYNFLKILSQFPFILYLQIRKKTFNWHKLWIDSFIKNNGKTTLTYNSIRELKFLTRRAVFLGNNIITEDNFIQLLANTFYSIDENISNIKKTIVTENLFSETKGAQKTEDLNSNEKNHLNKLYQFFIIQYLELVKKNNWSAKKLLSSLNNNKDDFKTIQGKRFIRIITIELSSFLNEFYDKLIFDQDYIKSFEKNIKYDKDDIKKFIKLNELNFKTNLFKLNNELLNLKEEEHIYNNHFLNFLHLKNFFKIENSTNSKVSLEDKTDLIFSCFKAFFKKQNEIGCFFIVTDIINEIHVVYDKNDRGISILNEINNKFEENYSIINNFLTGEKSDSNVGIKTIIEYTKEDNRTWKDTYSDIAKLSLNIQENKWVQLIRISDIEENNLNPTKTSKTLGLIGFYSKNNLSSDTLSKQLLMLFREDLGKFIKKHHKNNEFNELKRVETQNRFAYLAGHGRLTLSNLAQKKPRTFCSIVLTIQNLQHLFALKYFRTGPAVSNLNVLENIKLNFNSSFHPEIIDSNMFKRIKDIITEVYDSKYVENPEEVNKKIIPPENLESIKINKEIFYFICFELIVNAKKNRFHFIQGDTNTYKYTTNLIEIKVEQNNNCLNIFCKSTGVKISFEDKESIENGVNLKPKTELSGLFLISKIILLISDNSRITVNSDPIDENGLMFLNTICIKIEINDE